MSLGNSFSTADILAQIDSGINKTDLEAELTASGWIQIPAKGGSKSGSGWIWTSPDSKCSIRVMTRPDGSSYARVYNGPGGGAPGNTSRLSREQEAGSREQGAGSREREIASGGLTQLSIS